MGDDKAQRFDDALSSLVDTLVPTLPDEDEDAADERHENALEYARGIIEKQGNSRVVPDVQHAADLIKKTLRRNHASPESLVQFSNHYARLLTQPVLSQKWGILYLLHQLAESPAGVGAKDNARAHLDDRVNGRYGRGQDSDDQIFKDAFAGAGLPQLPSHQGVARDRSNSAHSPGAGLPLLPSHQRVVRDRPDSTQGLGNRSRDRRKPEQDGVASPSLVKSRDNGPSEAALLRDLPFTLQGLSAKNLPFSSRTTLDIPPNLPLPIVSILHTLAEPSLLYRSLSDFVESTDEGLIGQSLRSAIGNELRSYLGLISTLESEIRRAITSLDRGEQEGRIGKAGVTLKRCVIWTREATMGLRLMSLMVEEARSTSIAPLVETRLTNRRQKGRPIDINDPWLLGVSW